MRSRRLRRLSSKIWKRTSKYDKIKFSKRRIANKDSKMSSGVDSMIRRKR